MIILVDMDGVVTDFEKGFLDNWKKRHPTKPYISLEDRKTFYPRDQYPSDLAEEIVLSEGFYRHLPPIDGALEALNQLEKKHSIFICTSPRKEYKHCVSEKYEWINHYLGKKWINRMIMTKDKTIVHGDYLIDDRPDIEGILKPSWKHILYKQPFNMGSFTWEYYKDFL